MLCIPLVLLSREWRNAEGQVVIANLLRYEGDQVTIEREDGQVFTFSEETLSKADRDYLREYRRLQNQERQQQVLADFNNPLLADVIFVSNKAQTANELINYAQSLGGRSELVVVGERGLFIQRTNLVGSGIQRPSVFLRRGVELMAEDAIESRNVRRLGDALELWRNRLQDFQTPVPYLRAAVMRYRHSHPDFAILAEIELANCYRGQGDHSSAFAILKRHADREPNGEMMGRAQATYAQMLAEQGHYEEARKIAQQVIEKCPIAGLQYGRAASDMAAGVIAFLPFVDKDGTGARSSRQVVLLTNIDSNPRRYFALAEDAYRYKDLNRAIEYWGEYRKRFPNDENSRFASMRIARAYTELELTDKAVEAYEQAWKLYPDFREAWQARLAAAEIHHRQGKQNEALSVLQEGESSIRSREGKAHLVSAQADYLIQYRDIDGAMGKYIELLSQYGDQDAAQNAWQRLRPHANSRNIRDWLRFTRSIEDWLLGKGGSVESMGGVQMTASAVSELRRLALSLFLANDRFSQGLSWLKRVGHGSDPMHRDMIIRDEAWFYAEHARLIANQSRNSSWLRGAAERDINNAIDYGLRAWQLTDVYVEGYQGLESAYQLAITSKVGRRQRQDVTEALEALLGGTMDAKARDMLTQLYTVSGNTRALQALQQM